MNHREWVSSNSLWCAGIGLYWDADLEWDARGGIIAMEVATKWHSRTITFTTPFTRRIPSANSMQEMEHIDSLLTVSRLLIAKLDCMGAILYTSGGVEGERLQCSAVVFIRSQWEKVDHHAASGVSVLAFWAMLWLELDGCWWWIALLWYFWWSENSCL